MVPLKSNLWYNITLMNRICILTAVVLMSLFAEASWYWPFGSSEEETQEEKEPPRLSELMEPATTHIENAFDFAAEGKTKEAIEEYRKALTELDKIEEAEPERSQTPEFASLRTKRAYVTQAIESLLLAEVQQNAKAVAVTDTTELEKKLKEEIEGKKNKDSSGAARDIATKAEGEGQGEGEEVQKVREVKNKPKAKKPAKVEKQKAKTKKPTKVEKPKAKAKAKPEPKTPAEKVMVLIQSRRFEDADKEIEKMLSVKPHSEVALNLRAKNEIERGDLKAAEKALDQAIQSNPQSHYAYYNMVQLVLKLNPENKARARRYYETGRAVGGPKDENLEKLFK